MLAAEHAPRERWRIRRRLWTLVAVATGAPAVAGSAWVITTLFARTPGSADWWVAVVPSSALVLALAGWYGAAVARYLVGPLEQLTVALRRFDPTLGDADHPALRESAGEPAETVALKRALRQAVERIGRDRSQRQAVLGGLMHDLKTPLVAQSLLVDRLEPSGEADRRLIMAELRRSTTGAVVRLNRLIDVLRIDFVAMDDEPVRGDVRTLVDDAIADLGPLTSARGIEIRASGSWPALFDRMAVQRAVENIVANAVRHAEAIVTVEVYAGLVRVTDDGPGFARPFETLVDPFRAVPQPERPAGTAGLGLYIARRSLEAGGGRLKLESSAPGRTVVLLYVGTGAT